MATGQKNPSFVYLAAIFAMLFWGLSFIWTTIVFDYYQPVTTIFLRLAISSVFLFAGLLLAGKLQIIRKEHLLLILLSAVFNPFFYFIGENFGLKYSTPSITAVVIATIPLFSPVAAWMMIRERISLLNIIGIFISFTGIMFMLINPDFSLSASPAGILLLLFAVVSAVIYSVFLKRLTQHYSPVNIIAWQNLIGVILFLPLFLFFDLEGFLQVRPDARLLTALFSLAVFASSLAYILFTYTIRQLGVSRANVYSNLIPVITALASWYFLDEVFNIQKISGIIIVISGLVLTQIRKIKRS
jgi:drug/metabolite transporter (DMT)-like permease